MSPLRIAGALLLLLAACTPLKSPDQLTDQLDRKFSGRPVNEFFYKYGLPAGEFSMKDGNNAYRWVSAEHPRIPPAIVFVDYPTRNGNDYLVDTFSGVTETHYCELRVYTDPQDVIIRFAVAVDSIGKWTASRCSELFPYPF